MSLMKNKGVHADEISLMKPARGWNFIDEIFTNEIFINEVSLMKKIEHNLASTRLDSV